MLRPGDRVDRYSLVKPLGEGGQGSVWKAIDPLDGGRVRALKLIFLKGGDASASERARREANLLAKARHPALVDCYSLFEEPREELVGLVLEYVRGQTLAQAALAPQMTPRHRRAALEQLIDALAYIHSIGLVHRDIKLENVLVTERYWVAPEEPRAVRLVDFGIAAPVGNPKPLTATGGVIGTLPYLPPELIDPATWGRPPETFARDLFAFGVLAWELLYFAHPTGLALSASAVDYARAYKAAASGTISWPPRAPRIMDAAIDAAVAACLALSPAGRPASGAALARMLRSGAPPAQAVAQVLAAPTAPHRAPTPIPPAAAVPIAAPAPAQPRARTVAPTIELRITAPFTGATPLPPAPTQPMPPSGSPRAAVTQRAGSTPPRSVRDELSSSFGGFVRWAVAFLVAAVVLMAALWLSIRLLLNDGELAQSSEPVPSAEPGPPPAPRPSAATIPSGASPIASATSTAPVAPVAPAAQASACAVPCCAGEACPKRDSPCDNDERCKACASGRQCVPGSCDAYLKPERQWLLRVAGVNETGPNGRAVSTFKARKNAEVCVRSRGGTWACTPLAEADKAQRDPRAVARTKRLPLRTSDFTDGGRGFEIEVRDRGKLIASNYSARYDRLKNTALCWGIKRSLNGLPGAEAFFYLDDP